MVNKIPKAGVVTTTFYKEDEEGMVRRGLAKRFLENVFNQGYPVFVVDGSPTDSFRRELGAIGVNVYPETQHGLGPSRREAIAHAQREALKQGLDYLIWSEPEKGSFAFQIPQVLRIAQDRNADIVVPARRTMMGYPIPQINSEGFGNQRHTDHGYKDIDGQPLDTFFGPKAWKISATPYFQVFGSPEVPKALAQMRMEKMSRDYKLDSLDPHIVIFEEKKAEVDLLRMDHAIQMPVCLAVLDGLRVVSAQVDYIHPSIQTKLEEEHPEIYNMKRMTQLVRLDEQFKLVRYMHSKGLLKVA